RGARRTVTLSGRRQAGAGTPSDLGSGTPGRQEMQCRWIGRGGWKIAEASWTGRKGLTSSEHAADTGLATGVGTPSCAHPPTKLGSGDAADSGRAGLPEHIAPVQGAGGRGASGGEGSAEVRLNSSNGAISPAGSDRKVTVWEQPAQAEEGAIIPHARSVKNAP